MQDTPTCHGFVFRKEKMNNRDRLLYLLIAELGLLGIIGFLDVIFLAELKTQLHIVEEIFDVFKFAIMNTMTFYFVLSMKEP